MADDKNKNEDPEEEKDDQFDDDEDFGLPDLEYEELDDDEEEPAKEEEKAPEPSASEEEQPSSEEEVDITPDDIESVDTDESEDWEKELEKELEEEMKNEGVSESEFYEEESYEEFEASGDDDAVAASVFDSDDEDGFAAYEDDGVEYADSDDDAQPGVSSFAPADVNPDPLVENSDEDKSESKGKFVRTVVIGTLLFAVIGVVFVLMWSGGDGEGEKEIAKTEQPAKKAAKKPVKKAETKQPESKPAEKKVEETKPAASNNSQASKPNNTGNALPAGEITRLDQPTGKTYIIIGSFFDDDLAGDYANELAAQGKSPIIIPPFKDYRFYRVAIAEYDNFSAARQGIDSFKSEFGEDIWPLRY